MNVHDLIVGLIGANVGAGASTVLWWFFIVRKFLR